MISKKYKKELIQDIIRSYLHGYTFDDIDEFLMNDWLNGCVPPEVRDFRFESSNKLRKLIDELLGDKPDTMDLWRENLKAWNLKQRGLTILNEFPSSYKGEF
jgi:hypothetical protein